MKMTSLSLTFALALGVTAAGCAANAPDGDDDGGGSGSGSETIPTSPEGKYSMTSDYDVATNMPGTAGDVVNSFIDATNSPDDPTHWILDQLIAQLPDGTVKNVLKSSIPFVAGYLNDRLLDVAPDFVVTIRDVGNKFGQIAQHFGMKETLEVAANGQATKTVTGMHFVVDTIELDYAFKDYNLTDISIPGVVVQLDQTGKLTIGEHKVPVSYGKVMRLALDEVIIPFVDPSAVTLEDLLKKIVNCHNVGIYVYEAIGIGSASTFESACNSGLHSGAQAIYTQIGKVDTAALEFGVTGIAKGLDSNHDGKMDKIQTGAWSGTLTYSGSAAPLARGTFIGSRL
jgi:hypothetical protein